MEAQQRDMFFIWDRKKQNSTINTKYHLIYCAASCTIKVFGSLFLAMEDANSIFHEAWCNDRWSQKKYNKKEAAEIWSQQFKGFLKLYICVVLIDIVYQV